MEMTEFSEFSKLAVKMKVAGLEDKMFDRYHNNNRSKYMGLFQNDLHGFLCLLIAKTSEIHGFSPFFETFLINVVKMFANKPEEFKQNAEYFKSINEYQGLFTYENLLEYIERILIKWKGIYMNLANE